MITALYIRVSTAEQRKKGYSIGEQQERLKAYAKAMDYKNTKFYIDPGFSGKNLDRPAIQQLIEDIKTNQVARVIIWKLDRFSRSQRDTLYLVQDILNQNDVKFISLNENLDTSTPMGMAMIGIMAAFAELERKQTAERMQMGRIGRAKSGKAMAWEDKMYGYKYDKENDTLTVTEYEAEIVRKMFDKYLSGYSITRLKDELNAEGGHGKKRWHYNSVKRILNNSIYCGYNEYLGEFYKGNHIPIIDVETYERTQKELELRRVKTLKEKNPRPFQSRYMVSGLLYCAKCGERLRTKVAKVKDGNSIRYQCAKRKPLRAIKEGHNCETGFYYREDIEDSVVSQLRKFILDKPKQPKPKELDMSVLRRRITAIDRKISKLNELYINDLITIEDVKKESRNFNKEKNVLLKQINERPEPSKSMEMLEKNINVDKLSYEDLKYICNVLIKRIDVGEKITITWNL